MVVTYKFRTKGSKRNPRYNFMRCAVLGDGNLIELECIGSFDD
jgi:hypothetical protein